MLYNPARFRSENLEEAFRFADENPFATLVSVVHGEPYVSHAPLTPRRNSDGTVDFLGHLARANPHAKVLAQAPALAIFQGAHAYITPKWYATNDVPTWNYSTLHAKGPVHLIEDEAGLLNCLRLLTEHAERHWPSGWQFFIPEDLAGARLTKNILGFRLRLEEFSLKKKLSQNRNNEDRAGILQGLQARGEAALLADMQNLYNPDGSPK